MMLRKIHRPVLFFGVNYIQGRHLQSVALQCKKSVLSLNSSRARTYLIGSLQPSHRVALPCVQCHRHFMDDVDLAKLPRNDPVKGELVYVGTIAKMIKCVKAFSLSTSATGLAIQPFLISKMMGTNIGLALAIGGTFSFFIFLTPVLLHWFTKRYITKLYFERSSKTFTATTYSFLMREKEISFKAKDVDVPDITGVLATCTVNKKPMFLDPNSFLSKDAYVHLMSYDQPLEWELPRPEDVKRVDPKDTDTQK